MILSLNNSRCNIFRGFPWIFITVVILLQDCRFIESIYSFQCTHDDDQVALQLKLYALYQKSKGILMFLVISFISMIIYYSTFIVMIIKGWSMFLLH